MENSVFGLGSAIKTYPNKKRSYAPNYRPSVARISSAYRFGPEEDIFDRIVKEEKQKNPNFMSEKQTKKKSYRSVKSKTALQSRCGNALLQYREPSKKERIRSSFLRKKNKLSKFRARLYETDSESSDGSNDSEDSFATKLKPGTHTKKTHLKSKVNSNYAEEPLHIDGPNTRTKGAELKISQADSSKNAKNVNIPVIYIEKSPDLFCKNSGTQRSSLTRERLSVSHEDLRCSKSDMDFINSLNLNRIRKSGRNYKSLDLSAENKGNTFNPKTMSTPLAGSKENNSTKSPPRGLNEHKTRRNQLGGKSSEKQLPDCHRNDFENSCFLDRFGRMNIREKSIVPKASRVHKTPARVLEFAPKNECDSTSFLCKMEEMNIPDESRKTNISSSSGSGAAYSEEMKNLKTQHSSLMVNNLSCRNTRFDKTQTSRREISVEEHSDENLKDISVTSLSKLNFNREELENIADVNLNSDSYRSKSLELRQSSNTSDTEICNKTTNSDEEVSVNVPNNSHSNNYRNSSQPSQSMNIQDLRCGKSDLDFINSLTSVHNSLNLSRIQNSGGNYKSLDLSAENEGNTFNPKTMSTPLAGSKKNNSTKSPPHGLNERKSRRNQLGGKSSEKQLHPDCRRNDFENSCFLDRFGRMNTREKKIVPKASRVHKTPTRVLEFASKNECGSTSFLCKKEEMNIHDELRKTNISSSNGSGAAYSEEMENSKTQHYSLMVNNLSCRNTRFDKTQTSKREISVEEHSDENLKDISVTSFSKLNFNREESENIADVNLNYESDRSKSLELRLSSNTSDTEICNKTTNSDEGVSVNVLNDSHSNNYSNSSQPSQSMNMPDKDLSNAITRNVTERKRKRFLPTLNEEDGDSESAETFNTLQVPVLNESFPAPVRTSLLPSQTENLSMCQSLYLTGGKKWRRSFITWKNIKDSVINLETIDERNKGRCWRKNVEDLISNQTLVAGTRDLEECGTSIIDPRLHESVTFSGYKTSDVSKNYTRLTRARFSLCLNTKSVENDKSLCTDGFEQSHNLSSCSIANEQQYIVVDDHKFEGGDFSRSFALLSEYNLEDNHFARQAVLRYCKQTEPLPFEECFSNRILTNCRKIGEGVYGEVFMLKRHAYHHSVLKIIPIEGKELINGEKQKSFSEIASEIVISVELSNLKNRTDYFTDCFADVQKFWCVYGRYPKRLIDVWQDYDREKGSDNDSPKIFTDKQLFIVLELSHGGQDVESFVLSNALQGISIFRQVANALAVAEKAFKFEHRDLHWGNVLVSKCTAKETKFKAHDVTNVVKLHGVKVTIIDYTMSRISINNYTIYNDLALDPELFTASGDFQFEVYRLMRSAVKDTWNEYVPKTNVLWLYYLVDKLIDSVRYQRRNSKVHKFNISKLQELRECVLESASAEQLVNNLNLN